MNRAPLWRRQARLRQRWLRAGAFAGLAVALLLAACIPRQQKPLGGWSGPVPEGDALYVGSMDGRLLALEAKPGARTKLWDYPPAGQNALQAIYATPLVAKGRAYLADFAGKVYALDVAKGDKLWEFDVGAPVFAGLAQGDGLILAAGSQGKVFALSADTGEPRWSFDKARAAVWATPAVAGDKVLVASLDHNLYALDLATGQLRWTYTASGALAADPVVAGGLVYQGSFDQTLSAVSIQDGRLARKLTRDGWFWARPLVVEGTVYAPSMGRRLYALDGATGSEKWNFDAKAPIRSSPVVVGDTVVVATQKGDVYAVNRLTGVQRWSTKVGGANGQGVVAPLAASDQTVYVSALDHTIYALDARNGSELWHWDTSK